ncbi:phosphoenolpyruvate--protein phosphotransferase [Brevibacillus fluminis]|uniref:phosphoenolpyruvate--protein phosphotransferase n=1 Tax=Brevibacillus fluminis TaxID=511487 RepID=UPI003F8A4C42
MVQTGIAAAPGIVIGKAVVRQEKQLVVERKKIDAGETARETDRFRHAVELAASELTGIKEKVKQELSEEEARIFAAHLLVLQDPEFVGAIESLINQEQLNAEAALTEVRDQYVQLFASMENEYMRERASDLQDVSNRVLKKLLGVEGDSAMEDGEPVILVVHDLTPSDTAQLDPARVKAFVTNVGGRTSHSAIMARSLEIPAVVGLSDITERIVTGDLVIVDGLEGTVQINPDAAVIAAYEAKKQACEQQKAIWTKLVHEKTVTRDGHHVELVANIGSPHDAWQALEAGAEGIGLFRTEFLYMGKDRFPTEEEQFAAYKAVAQTMGSERPVIIRTLDIGGDKELPYLPLPKEQNPFLGYRAIRMCLDRADLFKTQLRAILRASAYGNIKIMYPMIATIGELRKANEFLAACKEELRRKGIPYRQELEVGIMIEVPAAVMIADQLAREVDFFSIGTNDLIQYTMAADRMNEHVSHLYDPFHPAVLRMIHHVIKAAADEGKWVGMCGEMAGEPHAIPILLGLGLHEFSMSATSILQARHLLAQLDAGQLREVAMHVLTLESGAEIKAYVKEHVLDVLQR